jgi:lipopolysaccharide export LptBFGC system permease protein LptF
MRLLDRYIAVAFIKNYLISFFVLVGMYIVLDMIFNFDELVEINTKLEITGVRAAGNFFLYVADYYFYQSFLYFMHLSGIIPVAAASFTLMRMIRFNELSALLSAGIPLLRIAMPVIIVSLLFNGLMWADQELVIPNIVDKLVREHDYGAKVDWFSISAMRDDQNGKLFAARYFPTTDRMDYVSVVQVDEDGDPLSHIKADLAMWDAKLGGWRLENGVIDVNLSPSQSKPIESQPYDFYKSSISPEEIRLYRSGNFVELLSTDRINDLLQRPESYGRNHLLRVKHMRGVAQIALNMVVLLLAIGAVLTREPQQVKMAAGKCVIFTGICMAAAFAAQELAAHPPIDPFLADKWPALMAWLPIFIFGPISVVLLDRVKT